MSRTFNNFQNMDLHLVCYKGDSFKESLNKHNNSIYEPYFYMEEEEESTEKHENDIISEFQKNEDFSLFFLNSKNILLNNIITYTIFDFIMFFFF